LIPFIIQLNETLTNFIRPSPYIITSFEPFVKGNVKGISIIFGGIVKGKGKGEKGKGKGEKKSARREAG